MSETFSNRPVQLEDREFAQKADDVFQVKNRLVHLGMPAAVEFIYVPGPLVRTGF